MLLDRQQNGSHCNYLHRSSDVFIHHCFINPNIAVLIDELICLVLVRVNLQVPTDKERVKLLYLGFHTIVFSLFSVSVVQLKSCCLFVKYSISLTCLSTCVLTVIVTLELNLSRSEFREIFA